MSDSLLNKSTAVINAIAITTALAVISGQLPLGLLPQFQSMFSFNTQPGQMTHPR